ncbi:thiamine diphosphokinase [Sphaerochaeta sp. PS]|uniref:thiamine diphosphokinase n=1 Tax=Sphaerochaeta sp. PS TaxID=3076336 RepID=UPI0028A4EB9E|nr:thiamine diphosphokinase [Sphaerochaeta sp. PS]MDT4761435.1 thiamine diphosphokinase [Sphaerochaeta sp. PS]
MSKAIVFTGGGAPASLPEDLVEEGDYLIAADSGYDLSKRLGYSVHYAVGDFDSTLFADEIQALAHRRFAREKDHSDTYLALEKAFEHGCQDYVLVGGGGYRMDHLFQTYALFSHFGPPRIWYTRYETNFLVQSFHKFSGLEPGVTVSFYPALFHGESKVDAPALRWPLVGYRMDFSTISLSNLGLSDSLEVHVTGSPIFVSFPVAPILP